MEQTATSDHLAVRPPYLWDSASCFAECVEQIERRAEHGREAQQDTDQVRPPRVLVVDVLDRREVHHVEHEHALGEVAIVISCGFFGELKKSAHFFVIN